MSDLQIMSLDNPQAAILGGRPIVNAKSPNATPQILTHRGVRVNSLLRRDEWETMDQDIMAAAVQPLNVARILLNQGLSRPITNIGQLMTLYPRGGEMTAANISMRLHASGEKDLIDQDFAGVPIPIIFKEYEMDGRLLASSRLNGQGLDTSNGAAAARVVAEKVEDLILNGDTSVNLNGNTIYGLTTHPNRNTDTAANFGGGDWGTITNPTATIAGMIAAAQQDGFYGPYGIIASNTQYNQAAMSFFNDGSGTTPAQRIKLLGQGSMTQQILFIEPSAQLADGVIVLFQVSREVVELRILDAYWPVTNIETATDDASLYKYKVMTVMTPVIKAANGGKSGLVVATGA
jgi:uncharacterized linocin/CFP29 family protein